MSKKSKPPVPEPRRGASSTGKVRATYARSPARPEPPAPSSAAARWFVAGLVVLALGAARLLVPDHATSVRISAQLHRTGPVSFTFSKPTGQTTSPACGCEVTEGHRPPGGWQGVSFPGQDIEVSRRGTGGPRLTEWDLGSPSPAAWSTNGTNFGLDVDVYLLRIRDGAHPTAAELLGRRRSADVRVARSTLDLADVLAVKTAAPIRIFSRADEPVAALSAPAGATTRVSYPETDRIASGDRLDIATSFMAHGVVDRSHDAADALPMLDVLSPAAVLVDVTGQPAPWYDGYETNPPSEGYVPYGRQRTFETSLHIFAVDRIRDRRGWRTFLSIDSSSTAFALRLVPRAATGSTITTDFQQPAAGTLHVALRDVNRHAAALAPIFRHVDRHPLVTLPRVPEMRPSPGADRNAKDGTDVEQLYFRHPLQYEFPPTPPRSGVNVFGNVASIAFADAEGSLTVGKDPRTYSSPTDLRLEHVTGRGLLRKQMSIPVRVDARDAKVEMEARVDGQLNGQPIHTEPYWWASLLSVEAVGIMAAIAGPLTFGTGLWKLRRSPARRRTTA